MDSHPAMLDWLFRKLRQFLRHSRRLQGIAAGRDTTSGYSLDSGADFAGRSPITFREFPHFCGDLEPRPVRVNSENFKGTQITNVGSETAVYAAEQQRSN